MPVLALETRGQASKYNYQKQATFAAVFCCIVASSGGLLFGYDLGVAGGVSSMPYFLDKFFHSVWEDEYGPEKVTVTSPYCKYDSQTLQLFQSSLYIAAFFASFLGAYLARLYGRKMCFICAGVSYLIGAGLTSGAVSRSSGLAMLVVGRCCLGAGVGFGNSSVTIYSSEMSPPKYRGMLNLLFQWCTTIGIIIAQLINYGTEEIYSYGWRISLAIAAVPALLILSGGIFLPETPSSLISRNLHDQGRRVLQKIRGEEDVELEFQDIVSQTREANLIKNPMLALFKPCYRPQLVIAIVIPVTQQLTGINAMVFYSPQVFSSFGSGRKAALANTLIIGAVNVVSTLVAILSVDRLGRRKLFIISTTFMIACEVIIAGVLGHYFHLSSTLPDNVSNGVLAVICIYVANFAWSWGPLGWLVPSEVAPSEIRPACMSMATSANMLFTFVIGQCFLTMMCTMKFGVFLFFAGCSLAGVVFIYFFLPECKGVHIEQVYELFTHHWYWKKYPQPPRMTLPSIDPDAKTPVDLVDPKLQSQL